MNVWISTLIYFAVYTISTLIFYYGCKYKKKIIVFIAILIPILFAANRYQVGTDYQNYIYSYQRLSVMPLISYIRSISINTITQYIFARCAYIFQNIKIFFGAFALFTIVPMAIRLYQMEKKKDAAIIYFLFLLGIFTSSFNIMKQCAAVSICFFALKYVYERKPWKYFIAIFVAMLFHTSSLIFIPMYFIWNRYNKLSVTNALILVFVTMLLVSNVYQILDFMVENFDIFDKYSIYSTHYIKSTNYLGIIHTLIFIFILLFSKKLYELDRRNALLIIMMFIGTFFELLGFTMPYAKRLADYFYAIPSLILFIQVAYLFKEKGLVKSAFVIYSVAIFIVMYTILGHANIIPYQFW